MSLVKATCWALLVLALGLSSDLSAQDATPSSARVRFRTFGWDVVASDLHYAQSGRDADVEILQDVRSPFHEYSGDSKLVFYRLKKQPDGTVEKVPAAQANVEGAGPWPLILFFAIPGKEGSYRVQVIPDDLKSFPPGSFKFVNYADVPLYGNLGPQAFQLQPGETSLLTGRPAGSVTTLFASVYTDTPEGKKALYTNNWAFDAQSRTLVFIKRSQESPTGMVARRIVESTVFPPENHRGASSSPAH